MKKRFLCAGIIIALFVSMFSTNLSASAKNDTESLNNGTIIADDAAEGDTVYSDAYLQYQSDVKNGNAGQYQAIPDSIAPLSSAQTSAKYAAASPTAAQFDAVYDPRTLGLTTPGQGQGLQRGTCSIFAAVAGMEAYAIKKDKFNTAFNLSENFYNYMMSSDSFGTDKTNPYCAIPRSINGITGVEGQNVLYSAVLKGPILESDFGYDEKEYLTDDSIFRVTPSLHVYDYVYEKGIKGTDLTPAIMQSRVSEIKRLVKETGSCILDYKLQGYTTNTLPRCTYVPVSDGIANNLMVAHSVAIIGWDDNFSKDKFKIKPQNNGAFIAKDSSSNEEAVYTYISYEDYFLNIQSLKTVSEMSTEKRYDKLDSNTMTSPLEGLVTAEQSPIYANVYNITDNNRELKAVGVFNFYDNAEIEIYVNPKNAALSNTDLIKVYSGTVPRSGYKTIELDTPVVLAGAGGKYAIAVKVINDGSGRANTYAIPKEQRDKIYNGDSNTYRPATQGTSYFSQDNGATWSDWSNGVLENNKLYKYYFCLNGYTDLETLDVRFYKPAGWDNNISIRLINANEMQNGSFRMTDLGGGVFGYRNSAIAQGKVLISDGSGKSSAEFDIKGKIVLTDNQIVQKPDKPIKISFKKPENWNNNIKIYYYTNDDRKVELKAWPGFAMQNDGGGWFSYTITDMDNPRIMFTDNTSNQTPGMLQPGFEIKSGQSFIYQNKGYIYDDGTPLSVRFVKPDSWGSKLYVQLLDQSDVKMEMTALSGGVYEYNSPLMTRSDIIISDNGGHQSVRLAAAGLVTVKNNLIFARPKQPIEIYFKRQTSWWKDIKVYYYTQEGYYDLCGWPGTSMTNIGAWWYNYTITDLDNIRVMFTDVTNQLPGPGMDGISIKSGQRLVVRGDGTYRIESTDNEVVLDEIY